MFGILLGAMPADSVLGQLDVADDPHSLVDLLKAAADTNLTAWSRGEITYNTEYRLGKRDAPDVHRQSSVYAVWEASRYYARGEVSELAPAGTLSNSKVQKPPPVHVVEVILAPQLILEYRPGWKRLARSRGHAGEFAILPELDFRPETQWFHFFNGVRWVDLLTTTTASEVKADLSVKKTRDIVEIRKSLPAGGAVYEFAFDLAKGGNLVRFEAFLDDQRRLRNGYYRIDWKQSVESQAHWFPQSIAMDYRPNQAIADDDPPRLLMTTLHCTPNPKIPVNRFEESSLNLAPDVTVEDFAPGLPPQVERRLPSANFQLKLDQLADELKTFGFTRKDR
jgi:hypothetical protein